MSNSRSKPTVERYRGEKSNSGLIATSSLEQHGMRAPDTRSGARNRQSQMSLGEPLYKYFSLRFQDVRAASRLGTGLRFECWADAGSACASPAGLITHAGQWTKSGR